MPACIDRFTQACWRPQKRFQSMGIQEWGLQLFTAGSYLLAQQITESAEQQLSAVFGILAFWPALQETPPSEPTQGLLRCLNRRRGGLDRSCART